MKIDLENCVSRLKNADNVLIIIHQFPDGDTIGCGYSLCRALQSVGKHARIICNHGINARYDYITTSIKVQQFEPDFVVAVDVADFKLAGDKPAQYESSIDLCIDHHPSNTLFAKETLLDADAAAACEIMYKVITGLCGDVDREEAAALYTGISTDTGCFKFSNTTASTHIIAAKLMEKGIDYADINRIMFDTKAKSRILVERMALENIVFECNDKCALITITNKMRSDSHAADDDLEGITALPRQIEGVVVGITVRERSNNRCKISVRTHEPVSASEFCRQFGGGGHARAAGCEIEGTPEQAAQLLLDAARIMLKECGLCE